MTDSRLVHCDFCGLDFDPNCAEQSCQGCPLARGCSKFSCPRCGYPILPEAKLVGWVRKLLQKNTPNQEFYANNK